jgi:hypothetical protein
MAADKKVDQIMRMRSTTYLHYVPFVSITAESVKIEMEGEFSVRTPDFFLLPSIRSINLYG